MAHFYLWRWLHYQGGHRDYKARGGWISSLFKGREGVSLDSQICYLSIRHTASAITARLLFDDGESRATAAMLGQDHIGKRLLLFYHFEPKNPTLTDPPRKGAVSLDISQRELNGRYWSDARTWGRLISDGHTSNRYDTYRAVSRAHDSYR
jgi:hypothetical protein